MGTDITKIASLRKLMLKNEIFITIALIGQDGPQATIPSFLRLLAEGTDE